MLLLCNFGYSGDCGYPVIDDFLRLWGSGGSGNSFVDILVILDILGLREHWLVWVL